MWTSQPSASGRSTVGAAGRELDGEQARRAMASVIADEAVARARAQQLASACGVLRALEHEPEQDVDRHAAECRRRPSR